MVTRPNKKFTPEVLLSLPRRSSGVPNPSGKLVLFSISTYDFEEHKKTTELKLLEVASGHAHILATNEKISDLQWLDNKRFAYLKSEDDGTTSLHVAHVDGDLATLALSTVSHVAGAIDAPASNLKIAPLDSKGQEFAVVVSALAKPDGSLYTASDASRKPRSSGKLYNSLFVRHWDEYETKEKNSLWYGKLGRESGKEYRLSKLSNALAGLNVECPIKPFGGVDHFDVSHNAIILVAKDPELNPALNTKCVAYLLHVDSWTQETAPQLVSIKVPGFEGAMSSPVFDRSGQKAAFLSMKVAGYEADRNRIFLLPEIKKTDGKSLTAIPVDLDHWDRSPSALTFTNDSQNILFTAEDIGRTRLFIVSLAAEPTSKALPKVLTSTGNTGGVVRLDDDRVFVHGSSLVDSSWYTILDVKHEAQEDMQIWSHSHLAGGARAGLKPSQVSWIWTPANNPAINKEVQSLVVRPSWYKQGDGSKYPVAYLIHGGPQGAWEDAWSTRWHPAVYAEQGYIVIAPNPTGSTSYGQAFTDAIGQNWGGDPYEDIVKVFEWAEKNIPEADHSRAVALGASYGGYMMNWIQGHDLGRKFKALVCHDGNFSLAGTMLATEELYFPFREMGGFPWSGTHSSGEKQPFKPATLSNWQRWDPSRYVDQWSTPQLVIHSEKDYRLTISEGLAAFNVLQTRGVPSQFLTFPDENHWVLNPENSLVWHKVVLNWINKYAGVSEYTEQDPTGDEFFGGVEDKAETGVEK